jgi:hypothetical protein
VRYRAIKTSHGRNIVQKSPLWFVWLFVSAHSSPDEAIGTAVSLSHQGKLDSREYRMYDIWPEDYGW